MPDLEMLSHWHQMPIIEVPVAFCHPHWDEFLARRDPERSMLIMALKLWDQLMLDEEFTRTIGAQHQLPTDFSLMNDTMRGEPYRPWCCYLGEERREAAWLNTPMIGAPEKES